MTQISGAGQAGTKALPGGGVNSNNNIVEDLNRDLMVHFQQDSNHSQYPLLSY